MSWQWSSWITSTLLCWYFVMYYEIVQILLKIGYFGGHFVFCHILNCSTLTKFQFSVWSSAMPNERESIKKKTYSNKTRYSSLAAGLHWCAAKRAYNTSGRLFSSGNDGICLLNIHLLSSVNADFQIQLSKFERFSYANLHVRKYNLFGNATLCYSCHHT